MRKLLETLDATKTPDENVALLKLSSWIKGSDMTRAQYDAICQGPQGGRVRMIKYQGDGSWWINGMRDNSRYNLSDWTYRNVTSPHYLGDYYFIAYEDYVDGNFPPEPA